MECAGFEKGMHDVIRFPNRLQNRNMSKMLYVARELIWLSKDTKAHNSPCGAVPNRRLTPEF